MQSILVTGGAGFIGRHLVNRLCQTDQDYRLIVIDKEPPPRQFASALKKKNLTYYCEDIRNNENISNIVKRERVEKCIHLAARTNVVESHGDSDELSDINVRGTRAILAACADASVRTFIFASTAAVYGEGNGKPATEDHELRPISSYGASKVEGEKLVLNAQKSSKIQQAVMLRLFNAYGIGQNPTYAGVITRFANRLSRGLAPIIYGDGQQTRDFISVNDVVDATLYAIASNVQTATLNIGTGSPTSINDLARQMISIFNPGLKPLYKEARKDEILYSCANVRNAKEVLGFQAKVPLRSGIKGLLGQKGTFGLNK